MVVCGPQLKMCIQVKNQRKVHKQAEKLRCLDRSFSSSCRKGTVETRRSRPFVQPDFMCTGFGLRNSTDTAPSPQHFLSIVDCRARSIRISRPDHEHRWECTLQEGIVIKNEQDESRMPLPACFSALQADATIFAFRLRADTQ